MERSQSSLNERLNLSFTAIPETTFWPQHVLETINMVNGSIKLDELNDFLTRSKVDQIQQVEQEMSSHILRYNKFIKSLDDMNNLFSFDVDYI